MPFYETVFITRPDIATHDVEKLSEQFVDVVTSMGGKLIKKEYWGLRNLAYVIKKSQRGHYVLLGLDTPYAAIKEIERLMGINEDIMRCMSTRVEHISKDPSPLIQSRHHHGDDADQAHSA
jgi:small subunit ribosomal protein S6